MRTVLHVMELIDGNGGGPRVLLNLAAHNEPKENRLVYVTYQPSPLRADCEKHGVEFYNLATLSVWRLVKGIVKAVHRSRAEIIITHHTRPLLVGSLAAALTGLPLIHHEHNSANYHNRKRRFLARWCLPRASAVVCCSDYMAGTICKAYGLKKEQVRVFYNPVEERRIHKGGAALREEIGIGRHEVVIGHVGGMIPARDQATLIQAFHRFHKRFPLSRLLMIGDGPVRRHLEAQTAELGLRNQVIFTGYTDQVGDYLSAMDIYVNSTLDEGFGIAVGEAMLAGRPVVLANAGAHSELIVDGEQGLLYPGGNVEALERALTRLTEDPVLNRRMAASARERAQARFSPRRYAVSYFDLAAGIIDRKVERG